MRPKKIVLAVTLILTASLATALLTRTWSGGGPVKAAPNEIPKGRSRILSNTYPDRPSTLLHDKSELAVWIPLVNPRAENRLLRVSLPDSRVDTLALPPIPGRAVYRPIISDSGALWLAWDDTLVRVDKKSHSFLTYELPAVTRPLSDDLLPLTPAAPSAAQVHFSARSMCDDGAGSLWIARAYANSLLRFDKASGGFEEVPLSPGVGSPAEVVFSEGRIWCTVAMGPGRVAFDRLVAFSPRDREITVYPIASMDLRLSGHTLSYLTTGSVVGEMDTRDPGRGTKTNTVVSPRDRRGFDDHGNRYVAHGDTLIESDADGSPKRSFALPTRSVPARGAGGSTKLRMKTLMFDVGDMVADGTGRVVASIPEAHEVVLLTP